jgi:hypothetical protein
MTLELTHRAMADGLQAWFDNLPRALRETGVDGLVIDLFRLMNTRSLPASRLF